MVSPKHKRNLLQIFPFGIFWMGVAIVYLFLERGLLGDLDHYPATGNPYDFEGGFLWTCLLSFIIGITIGVFEVLLFHNLFKHHSFGIKMLTKTLLYLSLGCIFLIVLTTIVNSYRLKLPLFHPEVLNTVWLFFVDYAFWSVTLYIGCMISINLFISEIRNHIGQGVLLNFFSGKYHQPRVEERVFMFLDMKSSTTIAEKLGHVKFFQLLKMYYADFTEAIIKFDGEIYQYVGDEIIITWNLKKGIANNNCLRCFFAMKKSLDNQSEKYLKAFGLVPEFKAGLHYGQVTTGEIGVIKKDIMFTGDVLNTTARIQGSCNDHNVDILLSEALLSILKIEDTFIIQEIGWQELKGKGEQVKLFTVKQ